MNAPSFGGSQKDKPLEMGGSFGAGPARSGFQQVPKPPALLEGFFLTGPDLFRNYSELNDQSAPWGMWNRPVPDGTVAEVRPGVADSDQPKVKPATIAAFYITRILANSNDPKGKEIKRVTALYVKKSVIGFIHDQMAMVQGMPQGHLPNNLVRLYKVGSGFDTKYKIAWMGQNPEEARIPNILLDCKLNDGNPRNLQGDDLIEAWLEQELLQDYYNLDPTNPVNLEAAKAREAQFANKGQAPQQTPQGQPQFSQPVQQQPMIQTADISAGPRIYTEAELRAMAPKDLRTVALQHGVIDKSLKPTEFKEQKLQIVQSILQAQAQQVAA